MILLGAATCGRARLAANLLLSEPFASEKAFDFWRTSEYEIGKAYFGFDAKERAAFIENRTANDSRFIFKMDVKPKSVYYMTAMIKTENVANAAEKNNFGANIGIMEERPKSRAMLGTNGWQRISTTFNTDDRPQVTLMLRLGYHSEITTGKAWFKNLAVYDISPSILRKLPYRQSTWNVLGIITPDIDISTADGDGNLVNYKYRMTTAEQKAGEIALRRFAASVGKLSKGRVKINMTVKRALRPLESLTWSDTYGFMPDEKDVAPIFKDFMPLYDYDSIITIFFSPDGVYRNYGGLAMGKTSLGPYHSTMTLNPWDTERAMRPERDDLPHIDEGIVHEWLHQVESFYKRLGISEVPVLHDAEELGYDDDNIQRTWFKWYGDYMTMNVAGKNGVSLGVPANLWQVKPSMFY